MTARPGELPTWKLEDPLFHLPPDLDADLKRQGVFIGGLDGSFPYDRRTGPGIAPTGGIGTQGISF